MDLVAIIILLGIVQGLFLGTLLISRKTGNKRANRILGLVFYNVSISMLYYFFYSTNLFLKYPHLQKTTFPTIFLYGPLIYFYSKVQTDSSFKIRGKQLLHFIPFVLVIISNIPFYLQNAQYKLDFFLQKGIIKNELAAIQSISQIIQISIYIVITKILINRHTQKIKNSVSLIDKVSLRWLSTSFNYFFSIFGLVAAHLILIYFGVDLSSIYHITIPVFITIFIYVIGYHGLKQPEIIIQPEEIGNDKKYERSTLTDEKSGEYLNNLLDLMENQKPYLQNDLTLLKLSEQLCISTHHLSQIINEKLNMNFYDFVNKYRVDEAKLLLLDPAKNSLTIFAIAVEAGFNSKSAFNSCFKKFTNITPSEYKKHNLTSQAE